MWLYFYKCAFSRLEIWWHLCWPLLSCPHCSDLGGQAMKVKAGPPFLSTQGSFGPGLSLQPPSTICTHTPLHYFTMVPWTLSVLLLPPYAHIYPSVFCSSWGFRNGSAVPGFLPTLKLLLVWGLPLPGSYPAENTMWFSMRTGLIPHVIFWKSADMLIGCHNEGSYITHGFCSTSRQ
jgi:hypothetical protein